MMTGVFSFGYGASSTLSTPLIIEMHGEERLAVVFGMQMLLYGMGFTVSAPFAGKSEVLLCQPEPLPPLVHHTLYLGI